MPRNRKSDPFAVVRAQGAKALAYLEKQIDALKETLDEMIAEAERWRGLTGGTGRRAGRPAGRATGRPGRRGGGKRVSWDEVLKSVPARFGVEHVLQHPGAKAKGRAQVYPALNRWEATKRIRRVSKGIYEKVSDRVASAAADLTGTGRKPAAKRGRKRATAKPRAARRTARKTGKRAAEAAKAQG